MLLVDTIQCSAASVIIDAPNIYLTKGSRITGTRKLMVGLQMSNETVTVTIARESRRVADV